MIRKIALLVVGVVFGAFGGMSIVQHMSNPVAEAVKYVSENGECLRVYFEGEERVCTFLDENRDIRVTVQLGAPQDMIDEQRAYDSQQRFEVWRRSEEGKASF